MMVPRSLLCVALALALGCTTSQPPSTGAGPTPTPSPAPGPAATLEPRTAAYDVHEWGLIDYVRASTAHEVATGPGLHHEPPTPTIPPSPTPMVIHSPVSAPRKPVLYFHLREGSASVTVDATVSLVGGSLMEHWPPGDLVGAAVRWPRVEVTAEPCTGLTYPGRDEARCLGLPDVYCEAAELREYETADASCLAIGGARYNHLFYRGAGTGRELPLRVTRNEDGSLDVVNVSIAGPVPLLARLVRTADAAAVPNVWTGEVPAVGGHVAVPVPTDATSLPAVRRGVANALRGLGLTAPEADAFERAWSHELFEDASTYNGPLVRDALLFFLPPAMANEWAELSFTPAPASLVRVLAVRIDVAP